MSGPPVEVSETRTELVVWIRSGPSLPWLRWFPAGASFSWTPERLEDYLESKPEATEVRAYWERTDVSRTAVDLEQLGKEAGGE